MGGEGIVTLLWHLVPHRPEMGQPNPGAAPGQGHSLVGPGVQKWSQLSKGRQYPHQSCPLALFLPDPRARRQHSEYFFQGFHDRQRFIWQSARKSTALLWESPDQKTSARKCFRQGQLIPVLLLQHYKPPLVLVLLQPGKKGWLGTWGTQSFQLPLAPLCPDPTWEFPQHSLWHWHHSGHGHNIHLSHNKKSHVFLSAPFTPCGLFNKEMLLGFPC